MKDVLETLIFDHVFCDDNPKPIGRYLVYYGPEYYPGQALDDLVATFSSLEDLGFLLKLTKAPDPHDAYHWWKIVDRETLKVIQESDEGYEIPLFEAFIQCKDLPSRDKDHYPRKLEELRQTLARIRHDSDGSARARSAPEEIFILKRLTDRKD